MRRDNALRSKAKPGDLLFYRVTPRSTLHEKLIAIYQMLLGQGAGAVQYSHVAIVSCDTGRCIEARWPKVRVSQIDWNDPTMELWRRPLSKAMTDVMLINACDMVGDQYDIWGILFGGMDSSHRKICTTLVRRAFASIGVELGAGAGKVLTPNELVADPSLQFIGRVSHGSN